MKSESDPAGKHSANPPNAPSANLGVSRSIKKRLPRIIGSGTDYSGLFSKSFWKPYFPRRLSSEVRAGEEKTNLRQLIVPILNNRLRTSSRHSYSMFSR